LNKILTAFSLLSTAVQVERISNYKNPWGDKTKMKTKTILITALLLIAGSLQAATIGYTNSVTMNNDTDATVYLTKFDSSLGTLTGVYVRYTALISGANVQMDNDSGLAQQGTARVLNQVNDFASTAALVDNSFQAILSGTDMAINESQVFSLDATSGDTVGQFNVTGAGDYDSWTPGDLEGIGDGNVGSVAFGSYTGTGTFSTYINSTYTTSATFDGSDGYFQGNTPSGTFIGEVLYTYEPIPEPATASMLGALVLVAAWIRRRFVD
jgi:hypothetical protein